ncbi:uncharacterized protein LOC132838803 isoform X2 [Tachysurus vachellii]|uniref:uncharacterized protein LOC132838803 isoform X2 n=1 Tax=Tachysurus vachellii TaxID=175792 RepID=UPI00296AA221|nr:uncharacterized protein LOC132838803 isoform X2 [Tachysurus vachellii]
MAQEPRTLKFNSKVLGNTMNIHQEFLRRLKQRLSLTEVETEGDSDFIVAFVPIVSRAGTDIEAALQKIPRNKTVVLAVLHFTFDENYIAPDSKWNINRSNVFAVDLLCSEDLGLLRSLRNDKAMKAVTDHLITIGASFSTQLETSRSQSPCSRYIFVCICIVFTIAVVIAICFSIYMKKWQNHITPTLQPNTTINSAPGNKTYI